MFLTEWVHQLDFLSPRQNTLLSLRRDLFYVMTLVPSRGLHCRASVIRQRIQAARGYSSSEQSEMRKKGMRTSFRFQRYIFIDLFLPARAHL